MLLALALAVAVAISDGPAQQGASATAAAELAFLDYLDARDAAAYVESGAVDALQGRSQKEWQRLAKERHAVTDARLSMLASAELAGADPPALEAMRRSLRSLAEDAAVGARPPTCGDARQPDLDYAALRDLLVECFVEHGNHLTFEGREINRGTALQLLHVLEEPVRRKAIFDAMGPLWVALNGRNEPDSPFRRLVTLAAADAAARGSEIDAAARAIGIGSGEVERWLLQILAAWRDSNSTRAIEPWDFRYLNSAANRRLQASMPASKLSSINERFYRDLGADLPRLKVLFDLGPRPDKSPLAYTDFLVRGRETGGGWQRPIARVVATYPEGGLFSLNELVHETGHAVHVSAIRTRPAYMDWPDTLFSEAFADVPAWSVHEPAWQRRYLGDAAALCDSQRALFGNVLLDVAWSLFELRLLRDPSADPNVVWTDIASRYLRIVAHPELPWWAMRVQLVGNPGYMINYGLGAVLTAEIRERTKNAIGGFDSGNTRWYDWSSTQMLEFGSQRDTRALMQALLGRPVSPAALLRQLRRCRVTR